MLKWSRVRLVLSILTCEGLWATLLERVQYVSGATRKKLSPAQPNQYPPGLPRFFDYAGAMHVHSTYSDGTGTVAEIAHAANRAGLDFVVLCDHSNLDALGGGQDGWHGRTLVLVGTEITTDTGHLLALRVPPGFVPAPDAAPEAQQAILDAGGIGFIALPCDLKDHWRDFGARLPGIGLEVFNLSAIARAKISLPALALVWKRYTSPQPLHAFSLVTARPGRELRLWDSLTTPAPGEDALRPVVGIASVDAHAVMKFAGRAYPFPTYEEVFRTLHTHVVTSVPLSYGEASIQAQEVTEDDTACVHEALRAGHCYMAYDNYADAAGFFFESRTASEQKPALMGDSMTLEAGKNCHLVVQAPRTRSIIHLYHNGKLAASVRGGRMEYPVNAPGVYRAEVFLYSRRVGNWCLGTRPWIFSNPIYFQPSAVDAHSWTPTPSSRQGMTETS